METVCHSTIPTSLRPWLTESIPENESNMIGASFSFTDIAEAIASLKQGFAVENAECSSTGSVCDATMIASKEISKAERKDIDHATRAERVSELRNEESAYVSLLLDRAH